MDKTGGSNASSVSGGSSSRWPALRRATNIEGMRPEKVGPLTGLGEGIGEY